MLIMKNALGAYIFFRAVTSVVRTTQAQFNDMIVDHIIYTRQNEKK